MEYFIGIVIGIALTLVVLGIAVSLVIRRSASAPLPEMPRLDGEPAVMVMMIEPFLNHQLREALASEMQNVTRFGETVKPAPMAAPGAAAGGAKAEPKPAPFKIKLNDATLDVQTGRRAKFYAQLTLSAWTFPVQVRPVADMVFVLHEGRIKIFVTNVQVGGFNVPRALVDRFVSDVVNTAEAKLNHSLLQLQRDTHVQLALIETTEDLLVLKFVEPNRMGASAVQGEVK